MLCTKGEAGSHSCGWTWDEDAPEGQKSTLTQVLKQNQTWGPSVSPGCGVRGQRNKVKRLIVLCLSAAPEWMWGQGWSSSDLVTEISSECSRGGGCYGRAHQCRWLCDPPVDEFSHTLGISEARRRLMQGEDVLAPHRLRKTCYAWIVYELQFWCDCSCSFAF